MADKPYLGLEYVRKMPDKAERCNDRQATKKVSHSGLLFSMGCVLFNKNLHQVHYALKFFSLNPKRHGGDSTHWSGERLPFLTGSYYVHKIS